MMRYFFNYLASVWDYTESIMLNPPALFATLLIDIINSVYP